MSTRLVNILISAVDPPALARFWAALLGWSVVYQDDGEIDVRAPEDVGWLLDVVFGDVAAPRTSRNRVHLDLASTSAADQAAIVERARDLGAQSVDIGQRDVPWEVLADPEGNEFCVLEPRDEYRDSGGIAAVVMEAADPVSLAEFWSAATGWRVTKRISVPAGTFVGMPPANGRGPWLEFQPSNRPKTAELNRIHLDVAPHASDDQAAEVERLRRLGGRSIDIGQGDVPWEVMADPEGNEYCVLTPR
jgi:predicted enzyme related to lactoylglutathione lyase